MCQKVNIKYLDGPWCYLGPLLTYLAIVTGDLAGVPLD